MADYQARMVYRNGDEVKIVDAIQSKSPHEGKARFEAQFQKLDLEKGSFELQLRRYEYFKFRDLALAAGAKSAANVPTVSPPAKTAEAAWSEPFFGMRIRTTAPSGTRYQHGKSLPLLVELQNVGDAAIRLSDLHPYCRIEVADEKGGWLGLAARTVEITPWERSSGTLAPQASLRWTVHFDRLRLNKPATGKTVQVRISIPRQLQEPNQLPRTVYSPPVALKIALASAGAAGGVPGSPMPRIRSRFSSTLTSMLGA